MIDKLGMIIASVFHWLWYKWDCQCYGLPFKTYAEWDEFKQEEILKAIKEWINRQPGLRDLAKSIAERNDPRWRGQ